MFCKSIKSVLIKIINLSKKTLKNAVTSITTQKWVIGVTTSSYLKNEII